MIKNGNAGNNNLVGGDGADYLSGRAGNDILDGAGGDDYLYGGDGNDTLIDGAGQDHLYGQAGDDKFNMAMGGADVADGGDGLDIIYYTVADSGPTVVDFLNNASNSGAAAGDQLVSIEGFFGSDSTDIVSGDDNLNEFLASYGNDRYDGRGGQDLYFGYNWDPAAHISGFEIAFGSRANALATAAGVAAPPAGAAVAYYELWVDANLNTVKDPGEVTKYADVLTSIEYFVGTDGNDKMTGSAADETFSPLTGVNIVSGGSGYDTLSYNFLAAPTDGLSAGVTVDLAAGWARVDVQSTISGIEAVNGSAWDDVLMGYSGANLMMGMDGNDALDGRGGNDELHGGKGDDILVGGDGADILNGGDGADILDGGAGIDTVSYASASTSIAVSLLRGAGYNPIINDVPVSSLASNGDSLLNVENIVGSLYDDILVGSDGINVIEGRNGDDTINGCDGNDTIYGDTNPASNVEPFVPEPSISDTNLIDDCDCDPTAFEGATPSDSFDDTIYGADGNDRIYGQLGDDQISGGNGNDTLSGDEGNDVIEGDAGSDRIDGGLGTDLLYGNDGNDTISGGAGFDIIFGGAGSDTVDYSASPSAVTVNLGQYWLNSGGDASTDLLSQIMQQLADGADPSAILESSLFLSFLSLITADGTDTAFTLSLPDVIVGVENVTGSSFDDVLVGDAFANVITGGAGNDTLDGGRGIDTLVGGSGNDLYRVDLTGDVVTELAGGGTDTVESTVTYVLSANVENLVLLGADAINGSGNVLANTITGNASDNVLNGGAGADKMIGGDGDDTYYVDDAGDRATETSATGGIDGVRSSVSFTLGGFVENLTLIGSDIIDGAGNTLANTITGNGAANVLAGLAGDDSLAGAAGGDRLDGGAGNDSLTGGAGQDAFLFSTALNAATNVDSITDFSHIDDTIQLLQSVFSNAGPAGALAPGAFQAGSAANDSADRIIYNSSTGNIYYDPDGTGAAAQVLFATVTPGTSLANGDFVIVSSASAASLSSARAASLAAPAHPADSIPEFDTHQLEMAATEFQAMLSSHLASWHGYEVLI